MVGIPTVDVDNRKLISTCWDNQDWLSHYVCTS